MPRYSTRGVAVAMGPGAGPKRCWFTATETIEQVCGPGGCRLDIRDVVSGEVRPAESVPQGANYLEAGGGVWAARAEGVGYRDSEGRTAADWRPLAVDAWSGDVLLSPGNGVGLAVLASGARELEAVADGPVAMVGSFNAGVAAWSRDYERFMFTDGLEVPFPVMNVRHRGAWLVGNAAAGVVLVSLWRPRFGVVLCAEGFNPDVWVSADGADVRVAVARTAGEALEDVREFHVTELEAAAGPLVAESGERPARRPWVDLTVPAPIGLPRLVAFFLFGGGEAPGNGRLPVEQGRPWLPIVVGGTVVARYVNAVQDSDLEELAARIVAARADAGPAEPIAAYWTRQAQAGPVPDAEIVAVECYRQAWESLEAFRRRTVGAFERVEAEGRAALVVAACYRSNTNNHPDLEASTAVVLALLARPSCLGVLVFQAGQGRAFTDGRVDGLDGLAAALRPTWAAVADGVTGVPVFPPRRGVRPPVVVEPPARPPVEPPTEERPERPKGERMERRAIGLRCGNGQFVTCELGKGDPASGTPADDGRAVVRSEALGAWQRFVPIVSGSGAFQEGVVVFLGIADDRAGGALSFLAEGVYPDAPFGKRVRVGAAGVALPFVVGRGEGGRGWSFVAAGRPLTAELGNTPDKGFVEMALTMRPAGSPVQSWQTFEVVDADTLEVLDEPF